MKVIQVIPSLEIGGAEIMLENLTYELIKLKNDVTVISLYNKETIITKRMKENNVNLIFLNKKNGFDLNIYIRLYEIFKKKKPDVIHTHLFVDKYVIPIAMLLRIKKCIHTFHSIAQKENKTINKIANRILFKIHNVVPVALSEEIRHTIAKVYNYKLDSIPVIFNGINFNKCLPKTDYSIHDCINIYHVGRFAIVKNHVTLIKAFNNFNHVHINSKLYLIGNGATQNKIDEQVKKLNLEKSVVFLGEQSNVIDYLNKADIFVLPSIYEGIPMTLIEAMGCGLPIIASNVGGIPDMLKNNEEALLIQPNVDEIVNSLEKLVNSEKLRKKIGIKAYKKSKLFSSQIMAQKYMEVYNDR